jgi:hypothetical protein
MNGSKRPAEGTVLHPEADPGFGSGTRSPEPLVQLARLPRRRRPGMIALAIALVGAGILASTAVYYRTNHQVLVLIAIADVPAGQTITAADVGTASVLAGPGIQVVPAGQLNQVVGQVAGSALHPGMLLTAAELARIRPPGPGQVLVPLAVRPSLLPASGLAAGDGILVVATPGAQGQAGSSMQLVLTEPVAGLVEAVTQAANSDGYRVVDLLVSAGQGPALAEQASTGQFALIVTKRAPR